MLAHTIALAQTAGVFDTIYVSTEDLEIARIATEYGAEVIDRPIQLAQDHITVDDVVTHALEARPEIDVLCCIYATAILLRPETIVAAQALLESGQGCDHVMGVSEYEHPPVQALIADAGGFLGYMWPEWRGVQSQQQPKLVVSDGTFYWTKAEAFRREKTFYGKRLKGFTVPNDQVSDVDTKEDLEKLVRVLEQRDK